MSDHLDYDSLRADTVRQVAKLMAAAAITAPKSGGQLFLAGKHLFIETVIVDDQDTLSQLAAWMRARGKERREAICVPGAGCHRCLTCNQRGWGVDAACGARGAGALTRRRGRLELPTLAALHPRLRALQAVAGGRDRRSTSMARTRWASGTMPFVSNSPSARRRWGSASPVLP